MIHSELRFGCIQWPSVCALSGHDQLWASKTSKESTSVRSCVVKWTTCQCFDFGLLLCVRSTSPPWRRGWGSGKSTCRTGAGRTCRPSPTPPCSGSPGSPATPASAATWPSRRPADWRPRPASTRWTAACANGQVGSQYSTDLGNPGGK